MTPAQIVLAIAIAILPIAIGGLVALGVVKGKMYNYVTYDAHRDLCDHRKDDFESRITGERIATNRDIDRLIKDQQETLRLVSQIHGYIQASSGGQL